MSLKLLSNSDELRQGFLSLSNRQDIADLLDISLSTLIYHLYRRPESDHYTTFSIRKNLGGVREIAAPITSLKIIQQKLNQVLQSAYKPRVPVHSYLKGRSILSGAKVHLRSDMLLNIDLADFFPSINFGRVQGLFMHAPYNLNYIVASTLAKICCYNQALPQGAPTSPIISNMICKKMDSQLSKLARDYNCSYTRYADDITFSTEHDTLPEAITRYGEDGQLLVGDKLKDIIISNGFNINHDKVKLRTQSERQLVTGIITNVFPNVRREYVRKTRAMLHAWEKYGLEDAEREFLNNYDKKHRFPGKNTPLFTAVVKGKIDYLGMIRGKENPIYLRFRHKLRELAPELVSNAETPFEFLVRTSSTQPVQPVIKAINSAKSDPDILPRLLSSIDTDLESKRQGAWLTFHGQSSEKLVQATHSMRELLRILLVKLAPDETVKKAPWYVRPSGNSTEVTRRMRVRYIISGYSTSVSRSKLNYIESIARFVDESYSQLCSEAHALTESDMNLIKAFMESGELVMLIILLNRAAELDSVN